jgi:hypothetical protein
MAINPGVDHHEHTLPQAKMLAANLRRFDILNEMQAVEQGGGQLGVFTHREDGRTTLLISRSHGTRPNMGGVIIFPIDRKLEDEVENQVL